MKCIRLNIRSAGFLLLAVILNRVKLTHMGKNKNLHGIILKE